MKEILVRDVAEMLLMTARPANVTLFVRHTKIAAMTTKMCAWEAVRENATLGTILLTRASVTPSATNTTTAAQTMTTSAEEILPQQQQQQHKNLAPAYLMLIC